MAEIMTVGLPEYVILWKEDDGHEDAGPLWRVVGTVEADGKDGAIDAYHEQFKKDRGEIAEGVVLRAVSARNWGEPEPPVRYERRRVK